MTHEKLFVYGSLKHGFGNHNYFLGNVRYLGSCVTTKRSYQMVNLGAFPGVIEVSKNGNLILGELFEIDNRTLDRVDRLESNGSFYTRKLVEVVGSDDPVEAWMYLLPEYYLKYDGMEDGMARYHVRMDEEQTQVWTSR